MIFHAPLQKRTTLLTAGDVSGTFDDVELASDPGNYTTSVEYDDNAVYLNTVAQLGKTGKLDRNQQNLADAINDYFNSGGTLTLAISDLFNFSGENLPDVLDKASGEAGATGAANALHGATGSLLRFLIAGTGGGTGGGQTASAARLDGLMVEPASAAPCDRTWQAWGKAFGGTANLPGDGASGSHDTSSDLYGIASGWDTSLSPGTTAGFALAGGRTSWDVDGGLGSGDSSFLALGAHRTQHFGSSYLSVAGTYGWHALSTTRQVSFPTLDTLTADFTASSLGGRVEGGHRFGAGQDLGLTPYGAFQADAAFLPDYDEEGSLPGGFALSYESRTATALRSEAGVKVDATAGSATLSASLAWAHDWTSDASVEAAFQSLPGSSFTVNGAEAPADLALVSLGASLPVSGAARLSASFDGEFGDGYQSYAATVGFTAAW